MSLTRSSSPHSSTGPDCVDDPVGREFPPSIRDIYFRMIVGQFLASSPSARLKFARTYAPSSNRVAVWPFMNLYQELARPQTRHRVIPVPESAEGACQHVPRMRKPPGCLSLCHSHTSGPNF